MWMKEYFRAKLLLEQNRVDEAEKLLQNLLGSNPESALIFAELAECAIQKSDAKKALSLIEKAIGQNPNNARFLHIQARAYFLNNQSDDARKCSYAGLRLNPNDPDFFLILAHIEFHDDKWGIALENAEKGLTQDPENVELLNMRTQCLIKLDRQAEAGLTTDNALHQAPFNAEAHANKGWIAIETNHFDEAINHFKEALRLDPNSDFAKTGLKEAIKGKNPIYRVVLKFFLWMSKMSSQNQWAFIIGMYVIYRILLSISRNNEALAPFIYPFLFLYILLVFSTWIAQPISNLFLRFHPVGKYALTVDEIKATNIVSVSALIGIISLIVHFITGQTLFMLIGGLFLIMMIPLSGQFMVSPETQARKHLSIFSVAMIVIGLIGIFGNLNFAFILFFLGIFFYGFIANYIIQKSAKQF